MDRAPAGGHTQRHTPSGGPAPGSDPAAAGAHRSRADESAATKVLVDNRAGRRRRRRVILLAVAVLTVAGGLGVHAGVRGPAGGILGDALYAVLVYLLVAAIAPRRGPAFAGAIAFAFCAAIELFQLTGIPAALEDRCPPAALVLGSTFSTTDLVAYAAGVALAALADSAITSRIRRHIP